jgi:hypothetical protein
MAAKPPTLRKVGPKGKKLENRLGKNWRKKVYGKKYKAGTLGKLGDTIFNDRQKVKAKKGYISKARSNLKGASESNRAAIEARLKTLISEKNSAADQIKGSKAQKQKFINLREKALSTTAGKLGMNEVGNARKAAVKAKLNEKTTNGGTTAPNDSSAQNNKKPHKVNVGAQVTTESGKNKKTRKQPKTNEGRKNKAQYNGGTTAR